VKNPLQKIAVLFLFLGLISSCATTGNYSEIEPLAIEEEVSASLEEAPEPEFNIPIVVNKKVEWFIRYFQTKNRRYFKRWLARSTKYIPVMQSILVENGLPSDLVYLAMIESGFNNTARSWRQAVGPWQFIRSTGKRYGLKADWWIDERRDPIKATVAAAHYLKDLYGMFDSWFLAAAGYNAGENKIKRAIRKHRTRDFWEMTKYRYLKPETKQYIPKLIAATLIAKSPAKYGFKNIDYLDPLVYDVVTVNAPLDLRDVARITGTTYKKIRNLNPELKRWCTPPDIANYQLKIPLGTQEQFLTQYETIAPKGNLLFHTHKIRSGDTLSHIARRYGTSIKPIMELNNITSPRRLRLGRRIIIPVRQKRT